MSPVSVDFGDTSKHTCQAPDEVHTHTTPCTNEVFTEGVSLVVRPPGQRWRPFAALSGGQQALAALALSFALQELHPSPFYFFDEIDACERPSAPVIDACIPVCVFTVTAACSRMRMQPCAMLCEYIHLQQAAGSCC